MEAQSCPACESPGIYIEPPTGSPYFKCSSDTCRVWRFAAFSPAQAKKIMQDPGFQRLLQEET